MKIGALPVEPALGVAPMAGMTDMSSPSPKLDSTPRWWTRASGQIWRMIPLTNVTIAYEMAGTFVTRDVGAIIVNRLLVEWISPTSDATTVFPDVTVRSPFAQRMLKDFTGG